MTFVDALAALQEGALPTNEQTTAFLERLLIVFPSQKELSESGEGFVSEIRSIVKVLEEIVQQRNGGEELQKFLWRTQGAAGQLRKDGLKFRWGKDVEQKDAERVKKKSSFKAKVTSTGNVIKQDTIQAGQHLRTLVRLALLQPELRHIIADVGYMFAEVVDKSTGTSIEEARAELGQVKSATGTFQNVALKALASARAQKLGQNGLFQPAGNADTTRLDALKQVADGVAGGMPALAALRDQLSATFASGTISIDAIRQELSNGRTIPALEELRKQAELSAGKIATGREDLERMRKEIAEGKVPPEVLAALTGRDGEAPKLAEDEGDGISNVNGDALLAPTDLLDAAQMIAVANTKLKLAPGQTLQDVAQKTKSIAKKNMAEAWTNERKERLIRRTKKLIVDCQSSKDYKGAIEWFIERVETFATAAQSKIELPSTSLDSALSSAAEPLIKLLENFADGQSLRSILATAKTLSIGAKDDPTIKSFWRDCDKYLRRCLLEEGFVLTKDAEQGVADLVQRFHGLQEGYKRDITRLVRDVTLFLQKLTNDNLLKALSKALKNILEDLTFGRKGKRLPSRNLWHDLVKYILPPIFDRFGVVPIPRIKYLHPDFDLVIENIAIELRYLLPDIFDMQMMNAVHLDFHRMKDSNHCHSLKIKIKGMSIRVYKLAFAITTRFGFTFHDHGIADLLIADFGLSIYIDVPKSPGPHYFLVKKVKAKLGTLKLKIHKSNHRILHAMAGGIANSYVAKRILRHFIAMGVTLGLKQLDVKLMAMRLNKDSQQGKVTMEEVRKQMAELRDLLRKYHEAAGTLEIDFAREGGTDLGKSIEDSHAVRWVKKQVDQTGRKEVIRNEWRSNAFDMEGADTIKMVEAKVPEFEANAAESVDNDAIESERAAQIRNKPEGPTDDDVVRKASEELHKAEAEEAPGREGVQQTNGMESSVGKEVVDGSLSRHEQREKLEHTINKGH